MGSYELIENTLHYTGDGWISVDLTDEQVEQYKKGKLDLLNLDWR